MPMRSAGAAASVPVTPEALTSTPAPRLCGQCTKKETCIYIFIYTYMCIHTYIYIFVHLYIYIHHIYIYIQISAYVHRQTYVERCVHMNACSKMASSTTGSALCMHIAMYNENEVSTTNSGFLYEHLEICNEKGAPTRH